MDNNSLEIIYGINPIISSLNEGNLYKIIVVKDTKNPKIWDIIKKAKKKKIKVLFKEKSFFRQYRDYSHQGIIGFIQLGNFINYEEFLNIISKTKEDIVFFDSITDTGNMGAMIRTSFLLGIKYILLPLKNTAPINETVLKTSTGAALKVNFITVKKEYNSFISDLKAIGYNIISLEASGNIFIEELIKKDITLSPFLLVIGGEDRGVHRKILKSSDYILKLNMKNSQDINSYNASVAFGISLYLLKNLKQ